MTKYKCSVCRWICDPEIGAQKGGIAPGTPFETLPETGYTLSVELLRANLKR